MKSHFWSHVIIAVAVVILTSAAWLTTFFVAVNPNINKTPVVNNYSNNYCNTTSSCSPKSLPKCSDTCEFVICESIPAGLTFDPAYPIFNSTTDCWLRLINEAREEILIGSFYWSMLVNNTGGGYTSDLTNTSSEGTLIYNKLLSAVNERNLSTRITQTADDGGYWETENLVAQSGGRISVRSLDFKKWYPGGFLHTKSWSVDGKHFYVGSANFDWRSLTQVKELGLAVFNCPCLAEDLESILDIYWRMGAPGAKIPEKWNDELATGANHEVPVSVPQQFGSQAVYLSVSPPGFQSCGREDDLTAMIKNINEATDFVHLAVMTYAPCTLYFSQNFWHPELDDAIRRAAFERAVKVRFMVSLWAHTNLNTYGSLASLQDISDHLPCYHYFNGSCIKKGSIEVRIAHVPDLGYGDIPFSRVYHNKYFVTEKAAYIGTSNWSYDYWAYTAGIGVIIRSDDSSSQSKLVQQFGSVFERDWNSNYTIPLRDFMASNMTSSLKLF